MNCPQCRKPMTRVNKRDKHTIRWKCTNLNCPQTKPIKDLRVAGFGKPIIE